jgi:hypothetical protein
MLLTTIKKIMDLHVLLNLIFVTIVFTSFALWMFQGGVSMFTLVINFLNGNWMPMQATFGLFETNENIELSMVI